MHPTAERWLLVERLDNIVGVTVFALILATILCTMVDRRGIRTTVGNWLARITILLIAVYFLWRVECAWKGVYYP